MKARHLLHMHIVVENRCRVKAASVLLLNLCCHSKLQLLRAESRLLITAFFHPVQSYSPHAPSNLSYSLSSCVLCMVICHIHHHDITGVSSTPIESWKKVKKQFYQIFTCHLCSYIKNEVRLHSINPGIHHHKAAGTPDSAAGHYDLEPTKRNRELPQT